MKARLQESFSLLLAVDEARKEVLQRIPSGTLSVRIGLAPLIEVHGKAASLP